MRAELVRLGRNTVIYGVGNVVIRGVSLLLLPVFTSYLTPTDYGISAILGVLNFFLTPVFALGVTGALGIVYFERPDTDRKAAVIWTAFLVLVFSAALLIVVALFLSPVLSDSLFTDVSVPYDLPYLVSLSLVGAALSIPTQPFLLRLQFEERARLFVVITTGSAALSIVLSILFIVGLGRGVAGFIEAGFISQGATLVMGLLITYRTVPVRLGRAVAAETLRLSLPLVPSFVAIFVMQQANKFLLQEIDSLASVGVYTVGFNIGLVATLVVSGFTSAWYPFFSSYVERQEQAPRVFARVMTYYVLGAGTVSLFFFVFARAAIQMLTQPSFHEAYAAIGPSAAAQVLVGVHSILLAMMYLARETRHQVWIQTAAGVASIALNWILISVAGILGAALGLMFGFAVMVGLQYAWNRHRDYLRVRYDGRRLALFFGLYVVVATLFLLERDWPPALELSVAALSSLGIVGAVAVMLSSTERSQLVHAVKSRIGRSA